MERISNHINTIGYFSLRGGNPSKLGLCFSIDQRFFLFQEYFPAGTYLYGIPNSKWVNIYLRLNFLFKSKKLYENENKNYLHTLDDDNHHGNV